MISTPQGETAAAVARKIFLSFGSMLLAVSGLMSPVIAQSSPAVSVGHQLLSITYDTCLTRAKQALDAEGYQTARGGGNFFWGGKGIHFASIVCDGSPDNNVDVHVFVASSASNGDVPGLERVRLQGRMDQSGGRSVGAKWRVTAIVPAGHPYAGTYYFDMELTEQNGNLSGTGKWSHGPTSTFTGTLKNGEVVLYRVDANGFRGTFWGRVTGDGRMEGTGRNDPNSPGGNNSPYSWTAIRQ